MWSFKTGRVHAVFVMHSVPKIEVEKEFRGRKKVMVITEEKPFNAMLIPNKAVFNKVGVTPAENL